MRSKYLIKIILAKMIADYDIILVIIRICLKLLKGH